MGFGGHSLCDYRIYKPAIEAMLDSHIDSLAYQDLSVVLLV